MSDETTTTTPAITATLDKPFTTTANVALSARRSSSSLSDTNYVVVCPLGCEYSASPGDYWQGGNKVMTCDHDDEGEYHCDLIQRITVEGTTAEGLYFVGTAIITIKEEVTPDDLHDLVPHR